MFRSVRLSVFLTIALVFTACGSTATPTPSATAAHATATPAVTSSPVATQTTAPTPTAVSTGPSARGYHTMATLGTGRGVLLYAGETAPPPDGGVGLADSWLFTGSTGWVESTATSPGVWGGGLAFDTGSGRAILLADFRGLDSTPVATWIYDATGDRWLEASPEKQPRQAAFRTAYDSQSDRVILFFGTETWAYDVEADTWTRMDPSAQPRPRAWQAMAYDARADRVILFGGASLSGDVPLADTWAYDYDTDSWTELTPAVGPDARFYADTTYEPATGRVILFGGAAGAARAEVPFGDTWAYDSAANTWVQLSPARAPSARGWHAMAYSEADQRIVLFGGGADRLHFLADTWLFDPTTDSWAEVR